MNWKPARVGGSGVAPCLTRGTAVYQREHQEWARDRSGLAHGRGPRPRDDAQARADRVARDHDHRSGRARGGRGRGGSLDAHRALNNREPERHARLAPRLVCTENQISVIMVMKSARMGADVDGACLVGDRAIALSRSARRRLRGRGLDGGQDEEEPDQDSGWRASSAMSPPTFTNLVRASGLYVGRAFPEVRCCQTQAVRLRAIGPFR
jgi:hypothetical protein